MVDTEQVLTALFHAMAKAKNKSNVVLDKANNRIYTLSPRDVKNLTKLGVTTADMGGRKLEFSKGKILEHALPSKFAEGSAGSKKATSGKRTKLKGEKPARKRRTETEDLLMWIGAKYYPTYREYISEARTLGCCKRIGRVAYIVEAGKTRVFLAHDDGLVGDGFIFGYFTIARIEMIVKHSDDIPEHLQDRVIPVETQDASREVERDCGWRAEGGIYFVSETGSTTLKQIAEALNVDYQDIRGGFVEIDPPIDYAKTIDAKCRHFRGALRVNGNALLASQMRITPLSDGIKRAEQTEWTTVTDKMLQDSFKRRGQKKTARILTEFAIRTGFSRSKVIYHYNKLKRKAG